MPSINISEADFTTVASAAMDAQRAGDVQQAKSLDKIARKINAALSVDHPSARIARMASGKSHSFRWQDVPSVLETDDALRRVNQSTAVTAKAPLAATAKERP